MIWKYGLTYEEKEKRRYAKQVKLREWHDWFAWKPVVIGEDKEIKLNIWAWLQIVERKRTFYRVDHPKGFLYRRKK